MTNEFAKTFTVKGHQVLVTKDVKEDETPLIVITSWVDGNKGEIRISFHEIAFRDKAFEKYTSDGALVALRQIEKFILQNNGN